MRNPRDEGAHPSKSLGAPGEVVKMDRDQNLRVLIHFLPDADIRKTGSVIGWVHAALVFGQREQRRIPCLSSRTSGGIEWNTCIIAQLRPKNPVLHILMQVVNPHTG